MVCATIFAIHKRSYNLLTSLLGRHHLQRSNQVNKKISKIITNGESKSDLPEVCRTQVVCAKKKQHNN